MTEEHLCSCLLKYLYIRLILELGVKGNIFTANFYLNHSRFYKNILFIRPEKVKVPAKDGFIRIVDFL